MRQGGIWKRPGSWISLSLSIIPLIISLLMSCQVSENLVSGSVSFDFDLSDAERAGYDITRVHVTLTHESGMVKEADLTVDEEGNRAYGTVSGLRIGMWDILVELYENETVVGSGTGQVYVEAGVKKEVTIEITLSTGEVGINVIWNTGDVEELSSFSVPIVEDAYWRVEDINNDGEVEILINSEDDDYVYVYDIRGNLLAEIEKPVTDVIVTSSKDYDGDGIKEFFMNTMYGEHKQYVYIIDIDENFNVVSSREIYVADIWDGRVGYPSKDVPNSDTDLIISIQSYYSAIRGVAKLNLSTGEIIWRQDLGYGWINDGPVDFDNDGKYEYSLLWYTPHNGASGNGTDDGDLYVVVFDEDGNFDIKKLLNDEHINGDLKTLLLRGYLIAAEGHRTVYPGEAKIYLYDTLGNILDVYESGYEDNYQYLRLLRFDYDGDGEYEILAYLYEDMGFGNWEFVKYQVFKISSGKLQFMKESEEPIWAYVENGVVYAFVKIEDGVWKLYDTDLETLLKEMDLKEYGIDLEHTIWTWYKDSMLIVFDRTEGIVKVFKW